MRFCGMCGSLLQKRSPLSAPSSAPEDKISPAFVLRYGRRGELRQVAELNKGEYVIGRLAGCHIQVDAPLVSRPHANLAVAQDAVWIMDLESTNGTRMNNEKITPNQRYRLQPGDSFEIAAYVFELDLAPGSLPPTLPPAKKTTVPAFTDVDGLYETEIGSASALQLTAPPQGAVMKSAGQEQVVCPLCQGGNPPNTKFCIYCHAVVDPVGIDCPGCGFHNPAGDLFCERCGEKLAGSG